MACHSKMTVLPNGVSQQVDSTSKWRVTARWQYFQMECHSKLTVLPNGVSQQDDSTSKWRVTARWQYFQMACHSKTTVLPNGVSQQDDSTSKWRVTARWQYFQTAIKLHLFQSCMWQYYRRVKNCIILSLALDDSELLQNISMSTKYVKFWTLGHGKKTCVGLTCSEYVWVWSNIQQKRRRWDLNFSRSRIDCDAGKPDRSVPTFDRKLMRPL